MTPLRQGFAGQGAENDPGGSGGPPFFLVALNLPHAGRIARRILPLLPARGEKGSGAEADAAQTISRELIELLDPCLDSDENPPGPASARLQGRAAALGRTLVDHIERGGFGHDRDLWIS